MPMLGTNLKENKLAGYTPIIPGRISGEFIGCEQLVLARTSGRAPRTFSDELGPYTENRQAGRQADSQSRT